MLFIHFLLLLSQIIAHFFDDLGFSQVIGFGGVAAQSVKGARSKAAEEHLTDLCIGG